MILVYVSTLKSDQRVKIWMTKWEVIWAILQKRLKLGTLILAPSRLIKELNMLEIDNLHFQLLVRQIILHPKFLAKVVIMKRWTGGPVAPFYLKCLLDIHHSFQMSQVSHAKRSFIGKKHLLSLKMWSFLKKQLIS